MAKKLGRNDKCHCGSGKKYKKCCMAKDQKQQREAHAPFF
ncbi:MAG: SEC-C metal-binding domain-containing protein [Thermodesulfobacteriota bacterium]